jgi:signal recognition particle subunit SRP54
MFENLQDKLNNAFRTLKGKDRISDINVAATTKEVRKALVDADVNFKVAKEITDRIREKALDRKILISVEPGQMFVKIVQEELDRPDGRPGRGDQHQGRPRGDPDRRFAGIR